MSVPAGAPRGFYGDHHLLAPRFSFAWTPTGNAETAVRGGIGLFYDRPEGNLLFGGANNGPLNNPPYNLSAQYQNGNLSAPGGGTVPAPTALGTIAALDPKLTVPRSWNWSLTIQRELGCGIFTEIGYVGSKGQNLLRQPDINQPTFGDLAANAGNTLRNAKPAGSQRTDGVMFYFLTGSFKFAGGTGTTNPLIDNVNSSDLTCDGNPPPSALNMGTSLPGNVLIAQCTQNGTYWDNGSDTTDSRGTPGSRGLLAFQNHANTNQPSFGGGGGLAFSGALYFHSTGFSDVLSLSGNAGTGTFILGLIIADQVSIGGGGTISLALTPLPSTDLLKVAVLQ